MNNKLKQKEDYDIVKGTELAAQNDLNRQAKEIALSNTNWGAAEELTAQDCTVSMIKQMQALSVLVTEGVASAGDWCDSTSGEVLAKKDEPLELFVIRSQKRIMVTKGFRGDKFKFSEYLEATPKNLSLPWEEDLGTNGIVKRNLQWVYSCLLANKITEPPYILILMSTKLDAAKKLNTMMAKLHRLSRPSCSYAFEFRSFKDSRDKGNFWGVEVKQGRAATLSEIQTARYWYDQAKIKPVEQSEAIEVNVVDDFNF